MELLTETVQGVTLVTVTAEFIDANNGKEFKEQMLALLDGLTRVVLDLQHVQFIDSSGCGALLTCLKKLTAAGGDLKICSVSRPVRALFDLVRMQRIMDIFKTCAEAVQAFQISNKPVS